MTPALRPARPTDAGTLGAMITDAVAARPWKPRLHSAAQDIGHAGQIIDRGWVTVASSPHDAPLGFLARDDDFVHALFVTPSAQGGGIGTRLLHDAMARANRLTLWTFAANTGAQRFYERHGFVPIARTDGDNDEGLPDIRYLWERHA